MGVSTTKVAEILLEAVEATKQKLGHLTHIDLVATCCGREAGIGYMPSLDLERVTRLVEHALFDHASPGDVMIETGWRILTAYEMRRAIGAPALTEHEEKWREANPV